MYCSPLRVLPEYLVIFHVVIGLLVDRYDSVPDSPRHMVGTWKAIGYRRGKSICPHLAPTHLRGGQV